MVAAEVITILFQINFAAQGIREGIRLSQEVYDAVFKPIEMRRSFQILPMLLHPRSKGYLKLKSRNPFHHPLLYPNFFSDARDIDTLLEGIREIIKITEQIEFQKLAVKLNNVTVPGCEESKFDSDDYWRCYIRHLSATLHHQVSTCKMGPRSDETAVVDANGHVHGFMNLRVADVSIIPEPPSGHTAAFSFVIGEKIADSILSSWKPQESHIQKLTRIRKSLDWVYQDPDHTTEARPTSTTKRPPTQSFTTKASKAVMNSEIMQVLNSLNVSGMHEHSQQFKNSTIGDVGAILWGSLTSSRTIDFKSKLAENSNQTVTNSTTKTQALAVQSTNALATNVTESATDVGISTKYASNINTDETTTDSSESTTLQSPDEMSSMEKIIATAPSLDEDAIKTIEFEEKPTASKMKHLTKQLKQSNSISFLDQGASNPDIGTFTSTNLANDNNQTAHVNKTK